MDNCSIAYFVEDLAHIYFIVALVQRVAEERGLDPEKIKHDPRNAGGRGRVFTELIQYLKDVREERRSPYDIVVIAIDANCQSPQSVKNRIKDAKAQANYPGPLVCAVPDPHIERWYLADPEGFETALPVIGRPQLPRYKCKGDYYKNQLYAAFASAGVSPPLHGAEYGADIAAAIDLFRAGRNDSSLKCFVDDLKAALAPLSGPEN